MYYRYVPYPYYRRYYPFPYRKYYPYHNFYGQYANIDQGIVNYGDMSDVIQDANIYQSMTPKAEETEVTTVIEPTIEEDDDDKSSLIILP